MNKRFKNIEKETIISTEKFVLFVRQIIVIESNYQFPERISGKKQSFSPSISNDSSLLPTFSNNSFLKYPTPPFNKYKLSY